MKKRSSQRALNQYSHWQYVVLIATLLLMLFSALPSWYGESPALQLNYPQSSATSEHLVMLDPLALRHALVQQGIELKQIKQDQATTWVVLNDAKQLPLAKQVLQKMSDEQGISDTQLTLASVANAPYWLTQLGFNPIALGLDLRGGVQFLLDVDMAPVYQSQTEQLKKELGAWLREHNMRGGQFKELSADGFTLLLANESYRTELRDHLNSQYRHWQIIGSGDELRLVRSETEQVALRNLTVQQNLQIMRSRIEELGITEAAVQRQGDHRIRIELPGVQDPAQAKNVIGATASLAFYQVLADDALSGQAILDEQGRPVRVAQVPVLTGEHIVDARASLGEMGMAEVNISLDSQGGRMMADFSRQNIGKPMATAYSEYSRNQQGEVVQSNKIISVATIQSGLGAKFRITGAGSMQDAQSLALLLRAGSLTAPVTIVEERTIGPTLGAENISNGFSALALGLGMTLVFMALWYRRLGWIANIALLANMVMLFGLLALIPGAVLTLPGIAGLVLTVGMAVDTNVLIFERIRDKLKEGNSVARAIDSGFSSATSTIFDANFTTMITAIVLYSLGNGPIQGFALTLGLGLLTSMFTGIFASRAMINWFWGNDTRRSVRI